MHLRHLCLLLALGALPPAHAATVFFTSTTSDMLLFGAGGNQTQSLNIQGFDPALGKLTSISLTVAVNQTATDVSWTFQNQAAAALASSSITASQSIQLLSGATVIRTVNGTSTYFQNNTAAGASFTINGLWGSSGSGTSNVSAANRPLFVGAGLIPFTISGTGLNHSQTSGLALTNATGQIHYTVTVSGTYNYTPAPEPATFALCGLAFIAVRFLPARLRKR